MAATASEATGELGCCVQAEKLAIQTETTTPLRRSNHRTTASLASGVAIIGAELSFLDSRTRNLKLFQPQTTTKCRTNPDGSFNISVVPDTFGFHFPIYTEIPSAFRYPEFNVMKLIGAHSPLSWNHPHCGAALGGIAHLKRSTPTLVIQDRKKSRVVDSNVRAVRSHAKLSHKRGSDRLARFQLCRLHPGSQAQDELVSVFLNNTARACFAILNTFQPPNKAAPIFSNRKPSAVLDLLHGFSYCERFFKFSYLRQFNFQPLEFGQIALNQSLLLSCPNLAESSTAANKNFPQAFQFCRYSLRGKLVVAKAIPLLPYSQKLL